MHNRRLLSSLVRAAIVGGVTLAAATATAQQPERKPGLEVRLYQLAQAVSAVPELAPGQSPSEIIDAQVIDLNESKVSAIKEQFLTEIDGFLTVEQAGEYGLRLTCDDGGLLFIGEKLVVNNDGLHGAVPKDGVAKLAAGENPLRIRHFQGGGGWALRLEWKPPGAADFVPVPAAALSHTPSRGKKEPGPKKIIPPLRRGRPGDGAPTLAAHPAYRMTNDGTEMVASMSGLHRDGWFAQGVDGKATGAPIVWTGAADTTGPVALIASGPFTSQLAMRRGDETVRVSITSPEPGGTNSPNGVVFRFQADPIGKSMIASGKSSFEMSSVRPMTNGLQIELTQPLDSRCGWEPDSYYVEQWPFKTAGERPLRDGTTTPVKSASVSADRKSIFLEIDGLKPGRVVYLRLLPPCVSESGEAPWTTEAWLTLNSLPANRPGAVLSRPTQPPQNQLTEQEQKDGWKLLFDGKTLTNWRGFKSPEPKGWEVVDGSIVRTGPGGDLMTAEMYQDFEFRCDWRICPAGNSGIIYRVSNEAPNNYPWETGPEMQVLDNSEHADGRNPLTSAGSNYALIAPPRDVTRPIGFFNEARVVVKGNHVEHWLNGEKLLEYELGSAEWEKLVAASKFKDMPRYGRTPRGYIVLQDHGDRVWYRNIKVRELK